MASLMPQFSRLHSGKDDNQCLLGPLGGSVESVQRTVTPRLCPLGWAAGHSQVLPLGFQTLVLAMELPVGRGSAQDLAQSQHWAPVSE